jgi:hypothetical protein
MHDTILIKFKKLWFKDKKIINKSKIALKRKKKRISHSMTV